MFQLGFKWGSLRLKYVPVNNYIGFLIPSKTDRAYTMITILHQPNEQNDPDRQNLTQTPSHKTKLSPKTLATPTNENTISK